MRIAFLCVVAVAVLLVWSPARAQEPLVVYDNFEGKTLDPNKWFGREGTGSGMVTLESSRLIKNETLLGSKGLSLSNRSYANIESDAGSFSAGDGIYFVDGSDIKTIEATVLVKKIVVPECSTNPGVGEVRTRIGGAFFNAGTPTPGDQTNDVWAQITVGRGLDSLDPAGALHIYARVYRCNDPDCNDVTNIGSRQDLGTVKVGKKVKLRITWIPAPGAKQFIFQKGKGDELSVTYGANDTNEPGASNGGMKRLQIQEFLPNCMSGDSWPMGYIEAYFDNVKVNASAVP
jgi:hypothetical protein